MISFSSFHFCDKLNSQKKLKKNVLLKSKIKINALNCPILLISVKMNIPNIYCI